jgi:tRNA/rRNA methyltransferase
MDNFFIILVEPAFPGNIGSVARAMKNMGFKNLRLVNPCDFKNDEALKLAVNAHDILDKAEVFDSLENAAADLNVTVATTAKLGKYRKPVFSVENISAILKTLSVKNRIGLVFGRERIGLLNKEVDFCNLIAEIPASKDYSCLNLSQSVLIFCYELFKDIDFQGEPAVFNVVSCEEMEKFYENFEELLLDINFLDKNNPEFKMKAIRKIFGRCFITKNELNLLYGIIRQVRNQEKIIINNLEKN